MLWNAGNETIEQLYNSNRIEIKPNARITVSDDCQVFMLNKKVLRGLGLVQLKDGDNIEDRYLEARENMYNWAREKWNDYKTHCEEREAQSLVALKPHKEILKYDIAIKDYEKWDAEGRPIPEGIKPKPVEKEKIYICPVCNEEFASKIAFTGHNRKHQKEAKIVDGSVVGNTSQG